MKPEAQRIAIAEACGWTKRYSKFWEKEIFHHPDGYSTAHTPNGLPDYLNDLNAMHEAERGLLGMDRNEYARHLFCHIQSPKETPNTTWEKVVFATAAQRAEAFLRTIGKWEDDK